MTTTGVFAGMSMGIVIAVLLMLTGRDPYKGVNAGFIALCCNFALTGVVSLVTTVRISGFERLTSTGCGFIRRECCKQRITRARGRRVLLGTCLG